MGPESGQKQGLCPLASPAECLMWLRLGGGGALGALSASQWFHLLPCRPGLISGPQWRPGPWESAVVWVGVSLTRWAMVMGDSSHWDGSSKAGPGL